VFNQLGVRPRNPGLVGNRTSNILPGLLGRSQLRLVMDTNSVVDPVRVDSRTLSRVRNLRCYKEELSQAAVPEEWVSGYYCFMATFGSLNGPGSMPLNI
jgi:hypothetical protein